MSDYKRKKNYFSNAGHYQKKRRQFTIETGMKGFLCTCNFREKDCIQDAYKLLNDFVEKLSKSKDTKDSKVETKSTESEETITDTENKPEKYDEEEDISTSLSKEINALKAESEKPLTQRKFQAVETGVKNVVFIQSSLANPLELVMSIIKEIHETKKQCTRFILRLLPIEVVCKANMNDIKSNADPLFEKYFAQEPKTFCIVFNRHSNNNIQRNDVIEYLAEIISKKNPGNKADLKNPELAVVVEVIRGVCLLSIAPNYFMYKKYNLTELYGIKDQKQNDKTEEKVEENKEVTSVKEAEGKEEKEEDTVEMQAKTKEKSNDEEKDNEKSNSKKETQDLEEKNSTKMVET